MSRGDIYPQERVERALSNFFRRGNLIALREMALQRVTRAVDRTLDDYVKRKKLSGNWQVAERVAVCISANPESRDLIARGARMAEAMSAEFFVLYVESEPEISDEKRRALEGEYSVCGERGRAGGAAEGQERSGGDGRIYCEEPDYAGDLRPVGGEGLEEVSLLSGAAAVYARCAACGRAHCDADGEVKSIGSAAMRILVVDDEPQITRVLRTSLQSNGHEVTVAQDGVEALELFLKVQPELVITDLAMPGMDGIELTREIRERSRCR